MPASRQNTTLIHHWPLRSLLRAGSAIGMIGIALALSACEPYALQLDEHWMDLAAGNCACDGTTLDCNPKEGRFTPNQRLLSVGDPAPPFENSIYCSPELIEDATDAGLCTCNGSDLVCAYSVSLGADDDYELSAPQGSSAFSQTFPDSELCVLPDIDVLTLEPTETSTEEATPEATDKPTATATNSPTVTVGATCQSGFVFVGGECVKACESNADCGSDQACSASGACVASACGDGICGNDENTDLCSADCQCTDNGVCGQGEGSTCNDCLPTPGSTTGGGTGGSCAPAEVCGNLIDDDCNGLIDDGC